MTDTTGPVVTVPANASVEATSATGAAFTFTASATDVVDGVVAVGCIPASGSAFPLGATTVTCTATDAHGNHSVASFTVTVTDTAGPVVTVPANVSVEATSATGAAFTFTASAEDAVDGVVAVSCTPTSGSTFPLGATTVSCTATDAHGNHGAASFTVTVTDTTGPVVTVPANATVEATSAAGAAFTFTASATDVVDGVVAVGCIPASGSAFPLGATTVTCTATDAHGNHSAASFTVTVTDTTGPIVTVPANASVEATSATGAVFTFAASAIDAIDGVVAVSCTPTSGATFTLGVTAVSCTATDAHGNHSAASFTVTVTDTTGPVVTVPANASVEATSATGAAFIFTASAADAIDGAVAVSCTPASGSTFPLGVTTVSCTATDAHGNHSVASFTVTVTDTAGPVVTVPANASVEATSAAGAAFTFAASATDAIDGVLAVTCTPASGSTFPLGATTVSCTVTDAHGNRGVASFTVTVSDTTPPVLRLPVNPTVEATGPAGALYIYTATATDMVDGSIPVTCTRASGAVFPLGSTTVTCTARDAHNNSDAGAFTVTVTDTTGPTLTVPANTTVEATTATGAVFSYTASATDLFDGVVAVSCTPASGSTFALGATTVTCTATDSHANVGTGTFTVIVTDTTAPIVTVPVNATVEATRPTGAAFTFVASATDVFDGSLPVACIPASGSIFAFGTTPVSCAATDAHGNHGAASFTVTVIDTTPPVVTPPAPLTVAATQTDGARGNIAASSASQSLSAFLAGGSAVDAGDVAPARESVQANIDGSPAAATDTTLFPVGTTSVVFTFRDASGNHGSATSSMTVTAPVGGVVDTPLQPVTATDAQNVPEAVTASFAEVTQPGLLTAVGIDAPAPAPAGFTFATGGVFDLVTTALVAPPIEVCVQGTFAATDRLLHYEDAAWVDVTTSSAPVRICATVTSLSPFAVITALDRAPTADAGPAQTVEATSAAGATVTLSGTGTDPDAGDVLSFVWTEGATELGTSAHLTVVLPLGVHSVVLTVSDGRGESATATTSVTVQDTTRPVLTVPANTMVEATSATGAAFSFNASATDTVDGVVSVSCTPASGATFPLGATTVNCTATDGHANHGTASFPVTVTDTTAPIVTVPANATVEATSATGAAFTFTAAAIDAVDGVVAVSCTPASGATFPPGATTVSCTATDAHGNHGVASFTVTVTDTTGPVVTVPANATLEATSATGAMFTFTASATDAVDGVVAVSCTPASGSTFPLGATTVNCTATDAHGNHGVASFTVTVTDTTGPIVTVPANATVEATSAAGAAFTFTASATDAVDGVVAATCTPASGSTFPLGATTVNCTATDAHGNHGVASFTVTVTDTTAPIVTVPANATVEATNATGAVFTFPTSAIDAVDGAVAVSCTPASGSTFPLGATTVNCTATDAHGNHGVASFTVTVTDTTGPVVTVPANATVEATSAAGAPFTFTASAADTIDGVVAVTCTPASGSLFPLGATTVSCTASDAHGNHGAASFTVTIRDTTGPAVTAPANASVEATSAAGAAFTFSASAADIVDGVVAVTCAPASGATFPLGPTTVNCTASDAHANHGAASFTVTVTDTIGPVVMVPPNASVEATSATGATFTFTASATDTIDGIVAATCAPASGSTFPMGATTVSCTATDAHGNHGAASFTVTITDTTGPVVTVPANETVEATGATGAAFTFNASATDIVDGPVAATCTPASGSTFPVGATTVNCTATDAHGNHGAASFMVTVRDTTGPAVTVPANATVEATSAAGAMFSYTVSATDLLDGSVAVSCTPASGAIFPFGATIVSCTATDAHGNHGVASFTVTVADTTGPTVTVPANATAEATSATGAAFSYTASATDTIDGIVAVSCTPASGATFPIGATSVTCTASDSHGNIGARNFTVTVTDTTAPVVTVPANATVEATGATGAIFTFIATASDSVDGSVAVVCTPASGTTFPVGATTVGCTATDARHNSGVASFTVTVTDTAPAVVTVPANATVEATGPSGAVFSYTASATDNVDGPVPVICAPASGSTFPLGGTNVSCTAMDAHHNAGVASFTVTVTDTTPPVITVPANTSLEATAPTGAALTFSAFATDIVDVTVAVSCAPASGATFPLGTTTVACTATDAHGNSRAASFTVTVADTTSPVLTIPASTTIDATSASGAAFSYAASATDVFDGVVPVSCTPASGATFAFGATNVSCTAVDTHGNSRAASFAVNVADTTPPSLSLPPDMSVDSADPTGALVSYNASATDLVDGSGNTSLVQPDHLIYEGAFRVPAGMLRGPNLTEWQYDRAMFDYGGTALAYNPAHNSLFVVGHDQAQLVAEIAIPTPINGTNLASLNTATLLQPFTDATDRRLSLVNSDPLNPTDVTVKIGGLLPTSDRLFITGYIYYDGRSSQKLSHFVSGLDLSVPNDAVGPFEVNTTDCNPATGAGCLGAGFFDGYFARVPPAWQPALGGPVLNGNCCLGVIGRTSFGPSVSAIDPTALGTTMPLPAKPLLYYPTTHPLLDPGSTGDGWGNNSTLFNGSTEVKGAVFPEGTRSVLFFGRHGGIGGVNVPGGGGFCYGFGTANAALVGTIPPGENDHYCYDPEDGSKGVHGYPYHYYVWAYDANDLAKVARGESAPWTLRPYAVWSLNFPFATSGSTRLGGATYNPQTGRIYISQYQGDGNLPLIHVLRLQPVLCSPESGARFPIGTTTVACSASDRAGNQTSGQFAVTVNLIDVTPPVITVPANATVVATGLTGATFTFSTTATDNVDGPVASSCTPASGALFPLGASTVTCTATDAHGNIGTNSFTVTVIDTTLPVVTVPADVTIEATAATGAVVSFSASATDPFDGVIPVSCAPANGATFPVGSTTVTCTATDPHGNTGSATFHVTVTDTTPPVVTVPANASREATSTSGAVFSFSASATDIVSGSVAVTCTPASGATFPLGTTTINCSATDAHANSAAASFTVTVVDTTPPVVTVPANATVEATSASGAVATFSASATDLVNGSVAVSCTPASGSTFPLGVTTVMCTATDAQANVGSRSFTVTVRDTTAPVLSLPPNATSRPPRRRARPSRTPRPRTTWWTAWCRRPARRRAERHSPSGRPRSDARPRTRGGTTARDRSP